MTSVAFDDQASGYDAVAESALGRELRARVHQVLSPLITTDDTVVDVGCGTGLDAAWLAPQVTSVVGFDASPEMVRRARERCQGLTNVTIAQGHGASLEVSEPVDLVLANFGAVNCVGNLADFGTRLSAALTPGGHAVLVTMPRWCPVELGIGALTANKGLLTRRNAGAAYQGLELRYASAGTLADALGSDFSIVSAHSLGLVLPPFEQRGLLERRPRALARLAALDQRLARFGARIGMGDHHIVALKRRDATLIERARKRLSGPRRGSATRDYRMVSGRRLFRSGSLRSRAAGPRVSDLETPFGHLSANPERRRS